MDGRLRAGQVLLVIWAICSGLLAILISVSLLSDDNWGATGKLLLATSAAGFAAFLLLGSATRHPHAPGGLYERIFLGLELLWIAIAAWHIAAKPPTPQQLKA
jgi:hypothetical protein